VLLGCRGRRPLRSWTFQFGVVGIQTHAVGLSLSTCCSAEPGLTVAATHSINDCSLIEETFPQVTLRDLASQFYLSEADVGKNRAEACR